VISIYPTGEQASRVADNLSSEGTAVVPLPGVATDAEIAGSVLGIGRTTAYALARAGAIPVLALGAGRHCVVAVEGCSPPSARTGGEPMQIRA